MVNPAGAPVVAPPVTLMSMYSCPEPPHESSGVDMVGFTEADPDVLLRNITATAITANPSIAKASVSRLQYFLIVLLMIFLSPLQDRFIPIAGAQNDRPDRRRIGTEVDAELKSKRGASRPASRTKVQ